MQSAFAYVTAGQEDLAALAARIADAGAQLAAVARYPAGGAGTGGADDRPAVAVGVLPAAAGEAPDLAAVRIARELAALAASALRLSVERARAADHTWQKIGDLLDVSRQAAFQRFGRPIDPRTGEPMSNAVLPGAGERATELLIDWIEERYDRLIGSFDKTMTGALPADKLAATWAQVIGMVGGYEGMREPLVRQLGDHTVADVPLRFEAADMKGRVAFDTQGRVAGLFVLSADAP